MGSSRKFKLEPTVRNSSVKSNSAVAASRFEDPKFGFFPAYPGTFRWHGGFAWIPTVYDCYIYQPPRTLNLEASYEHLALSHASQQPERLRKLLTDC